jgi:hypothetical protein
LTRFLLLSSTGPELWEYIKKDNGYTTRDTLARLTQLDNNSIDSFLVADDSAMHLEAVLREHGPVLLSIRVTEDLLADDLVSYVGTKHTMAVDWLGAPLLHDVVVVGVRAVSPGGGTKRFLVQSWWETKQFLEVDVVYLRLCGAKATYIKSRDFMVWPEGLPLIHGRFVESVLGGRDTTGV